MATRHRPSLVGLPANFVEEISMTDAEDARAELIAAMVAASSKVRHLGLPLDRFLSLDAYELLDDVDDLTSVPADEIEMAHARRGAVIMAAEQVIDQCIDDLQEIDFDDDGMPDRDRAEESFVYTAFPKRHRSAYNERFFRRTLVTAVKIAHDLANPDGAEAACTAEEIIIDAIGEIATTTCELAEIPEPAIDLIEALLEDADFEFLFDADMDGIEEDPARQAAMGIHVPDVADWFSPFNPSCIVHPYAETGPQDRPVVHNLLDRIDAPDEQEAVLASEAIDSPAPIAGLAAASEVVALARRTAAADANSTMWVADETVPESSFADLRSMATAADHGSGWITWEPYDGADIVRTDPIVYLAPHRHFPIGGDCPWVWAGVGGARMLAIPLSVVVSYRPDPEVRRRWNNALSPAAD
jgi:hypothetical protein